MPGQDSDSTFSFHSGGTWHAAAMSTFHCIDRKSCEFPQALLALAPWPPCLYYRGHFHEKGPSVSIVGARAAGREGLQIAYDLGVSLAQAGYRVISGGALGIDGAAHRGALRGQGYTLAILGCGLDTDYPARHAGLFAEIEASGGGILSPFETGYPPLPANFVRRNKLIALLADVVVVVEAQAASGSLHTARFASRYKRKLAVFSGSRGCEALLSQGALHVQSPEDVKAVLAGGGHQRQLPRPEAGSVESQIFSVLDQGQAMGLADIAQCADLPLRAVRRVLQSLQMQSLVIALPGLYYQQCPSSLLLPET